MTNFIWKLIDEYDTLPAAKSIECCTNTFRILCTNSIESIEVPSDDYKFRRDEILGVLNTLRYAMRSGKKILLLHNHIWYKYIRFLKTSETVEIFGRTEPIYVAYLSTADKKELLSREMLNNLIKEQE